VGACNALGTWRASELTSDGLGHETMTSIVDTDLQPDAPLGTGFEATFVCFISD